MDHEQFTSELLRSSGGDLERLVDALAKAAKEHDRFISITITISSNDEQVPEQESEE